MIFLVTLANGRILGILSIYSLLQQAISLPWYDNTLMPILAWKLPDIFLPLRKKEKKCIDKKSELGLIREIEARAKQINLALSRRNKIEASLLSLF